MSRYRCFLPDLTGFATLFCAGPSYHSYSPSTLCPCRSRPHAQAQPGPRPGERYRSDRADREAARRRNGGGMPLAASRSRTIRPKRRAAPPSGQELRRRHASTSARATERSLVRVTSELAAVVLRRIGHAEAARPARRRPVGMQLENDRGVGREICLAIRRRGERQRLPLALQLHTGFAGTRSPDRARRIYAAHAARMSIEQIAIAVRTRAGATPYARPRRSNWRRRLRRCRRAHRARLASR